MKQFTVQVRLNGSFGSEVHEFDVVAETANEAQDLAEYALRNVREYCVEGVYEKKSI